MRACTFACKRSYQKSPPRIRASHDHDSVMRFVRAAG